MIFQSQRGIHQTNSTEKGIESSEICLHNPHQKNDVYLLHQTVTKEPSDLDSKSLHHDDNPRSITDLPPALITEIFNFLEPSEIGVVSCVSPFFYQIASDHHVWQSLYRERWGIPVASTLLSCDKSWKEIFLEKEVRSKTFMGSYSIDMLYGHTEAVRTVFLLVSAKIIFTAGYDAVVHLWSMDEGLLITSSPPLGCTIRALAADTSLLVAGGSDGVIHCWRAVECSHLFDLKNSIDQGADFRIRGHDGPITCIFLDKSTIYSGSWDMTVRLWDRSSLECVSVLWHSDWVWSIAPRDTTLASSSGSDIYIWDIRDGSLVGNLLNIHTGNTYAVARSHTGKLLFSGGEDGVVRMFEVVVVRRKIKAFPVATWIPHTGPVQSLAFEFPWLVSASNDGKLSLIDVRKLMRRTRRRWSSHMSTNQTGADNDLEPPQRMLHGFGCNMFSVAIGADRIVCGGEESPVRVWNFSKALERAQRACTLRGLRLENRLRRRRRQIEMNCKGGGTDYCSMAAQKSSGSGDGIGCSRNSKLKA